MPAPQLQPEPALPIDDPVPILEEQQPPGDVDAELPEAEAEGAPVLNIEDLRRRYPIRSNRSTWKERNYFTSRAIVVKIKANDKLNLERLRALNERSRHINIKFFLSATAHRRGR